MYEFECLTDELAAEELNEACSPFFGECYPVGTDSHNPE